MIGNFKKSKIIYSQILSFYLLDSDLLFINSYYNLLKMCLKDKNKKNAVLNYLNSVMNNHIKNFKYF